MKTYLAEVLGTFLLVFIGTASVATGGFLADLPLGQEAIGLAFGIGLIAAAYAVGPISGAHLNPAVTLGVFLAGIVTIKCLHSAPSTSTEHLAPSTSTEHLAPSTEH